MKNRNGSWFRLVLFEYLHE